NCWTTFARFDIGSPRAGIVAGQPARLLSVRQPFPVVSISPANQRNAMRLRTNELCPIHRSLSCCGREFLPKPKVIRLGVQRIEDPHHPRGYRELRSPAEMRKLLNRKIRQQAGTSPKRSSLLHRREE